MPRPAPPVVEVAEALEGGAADVVVGVGAGVDVVAGVEAELAAGVVADALAPVVALPDADAVDDPLELELELELDPDVPALADAMVPVGTVNAGVPVVFAAEPPELPHATVPALRTIAARIAAAGRPGMRRAGETSMPTGRPEPAAPCACRSTDSR